MKHLILVLAVLLAALALTIAAPPLADLDTAATGYGPHGQVHIEVHRGPTKKHGYDYFAPFSYYVRQPEDYNVYHKGYH